MTQIVTILQEESEEVETLQYMYQGYLDILGYLFSQYNLDEHHPIINKKFDDAVLIYTELEKTKQSLADKYKPNGRWPFYSFNFDKFQIIFRDA